MEMTSTQHRERVVAALVLASWCTEQKLISTPLLTTPIIELFHHDLPQASAASTELLREIKAARAVSAPEFGIDEPVFLRLDVPGKTKEDCQAIWYPRFDTVFDTLGITDPADREEYLFSGLGYESLRLCVVAYSRDWNKAFVYHEYLHIKYKGLTNTYFDEMITEALAYAACGYVDLATYTITPLQSLIDWGINVDYYHALADFLILCAAHPTLFPYLRELYENGRDEDLYKISEIIGKDLFGRLLHTPPDTHP